MRVVLKLKAKEPLSVGFESVGTTVLLYKLPIVKEDGELLEVPIIPGNSIRGAFRDEMAIQFLRDVKRVWEAKKSGSAGEFTANAGTLMTLFSGGILARAGEQELTAKKISNKMESYVKPLLPLSIMGCALAKFMVPSKLKFGIGYPVVEETYDLIDDLVREQPKTKLSDILISVQMIRKDDKAKISQLEIKTNFEELDRILGLEKEGREEAAVQQIFTREAIAPGTVFVTYIEELIPLTDAEWGLVFKTLKNFPNVGGSVVRGFGSLEVSYSSSINTQDYEQAYEKLVQDRIDQIFEALNDAPEIKERSRRR
ncbi:RAMP superfamily CRISPR-associated protein [Candidatus Alkanophaga liquidiphilum]|nr:hypothetical protein [Candidatus Alkanophaga liquidiphilum]